MQCQTKKERNTKMTIDEMRNNYYQMLVDSGELAEICGKENATPQDIPEEFVLNYYSELESNNF